jgi:hypothetical protein
VSAIAPPIRDLRAALLRPTLPALWGFLAVALPALAAVVAPMPMVDLGYQLRAGSDILGGAGIPTQDAWTFTAQGVPWVDQQWLAQAVLAAAYRLGSWTGLVLLRVALVAGTFWLLSRAIRARRPTLGPRTVALLALGAFVLAAPGLGLRPQLFGFVLFAATLFLVTDREAHPTRVWLVPVLAALWASLHGTYVLAPVLAGVAWLEDLHARSPRRHSMLGVAIVAAAATALNPLGIDVWAYAVRLATNTQIAGRVSEWQHTTLADPGGVLFWISVALVVAVVAVRRSSVTWPMLVTLLAFGALGGWTLRAIGWWALVAAVVVAGLLPVRVVDGVDGGVDGGSARRPALGSPLNAVVGLAIVVVSVVLLPGWRAPASVYGAPEGLLTYAPAGITQQLRVTSTARLMPIRTVWAPQVWTSAFELAAPDKLYAVDSRIEIFPAAVWRDVDAVAAGGAQALAILDRYRVEAVVTRRSGDEALEATLAASSGASGDVQERVWARSYTDDDGSIWIRGGSLSTPPDATP